MKRLARLFLFFIRFRYRLEIKNFPKLDPQHNYLVLPNHISYLEPMIMFSLLYEKIKIRPVATSRFAENWIFQPIFKAINAISIEESQLKSNDDEHLAQKLNSSLETLENALKNQDSLLLYPSGQLAGQGKEYLGGKKSAYLAVQSAPEQTRIIAVRVRGLRGSIWSNARNGESPDFILGMLKAIWYFVSNLFFFAPKRKVSIEFEDLTEELKDKSKASLEDFNQHLENFYNAKGEEQVQFLPHYFFYNDTKHKQLPKKIHNSLQELQSTRSYDTSKFDPTVIDQVFAFLKEIKKEEKLTPSLENHLVMDLYLDSLDMAELKNFILSHYPKASNTPILELKTVADLVAMAMGLSKSESDDFKPCDRDIKQLSSEWKLDPEKTILENFKAQWKDDPDATQVFDQFFGLQTRKDLALKSLLIADYLKEIEGEYIGIMLPALSSTSILLLSCYLAEKIPVMMNWTHPEPAFAHCVKFSKTKKILTSKAFFQKINIERLKKYDFIFLEDLLKNIPLHRKLKALVKSWTFPLPKHPSETAVILYTSGSEALPKAVPLTHHNLISNLKGALDILHIQHDERLLCYLPPFHSFGFTVNTILPLVTGLRSINTPDPNDSLSVAKLIAHAKPTLLATTPTFLRNLLNIASPDQLSSLRYVITGGEKCSEAVFEKFKRLIP